MSTIRFYDRTASLGMPYGVYDFNESTVKEKVEPKKMGNYAIGFMAPGGGFAPKIIGGSDDDMQNELRSRIENAQKRGYDKFCFRYASSPQDRFEHECWNHHRYERQLDNKDHPHSPVGMNLSCPLTACAMFFQKSDTQNNKDQV